MTRTDHDVPGPLRVIAVGQSGLERALGAARDISFVRTRSGLDAIGALGLPVLEEGEHPIVLVGASATGVEDIPPLLAGLREVNPAVRIVATPDALTTMSDAGRQGVDATIDLHDPVASLHALAASLTETRGASQDADAFGHVGTPEAQAPRSSQRDAPETTGAHLQAILRGESTAELEVGSMRATLGTDDIHFVGAADDAPAQDPARCVLAVRYRGTQVGALIGPAAHRAALEGALQRLALCAAIDRQQESLRRSAFVDHLTGAWNRRYFDRALDAAVRRARVERRPVTVLIFDIDDFKHYNDSYGHAAGDEILIETVNLLTALTRPTDRVCRVGGDEFAVIFDEPDGPREAGSTPPTSVSQITKRFQAQICGHRFPKLGEQAAGSLSISGGLATFPWDGNDPTSLVEHADRLCMASKQDGKNAIRFGPGAMATCEPDAEQD
jgi:two-component system cell cycle response regulator